MKVLLIDNETSYISDLLSTLTSVGVIVVNFNQVSLSDVYDCDAVILSGGHSLPIENHEAEYAREIEIIKRFGKPILGICLGFELIGKVFGCQLGYLPRKEHGILQIHIVKENPLTLSAKELSVYESHQVCITDLSPELEILAKSSDGVEIFTHKERKIFATQFHPEKQVDDGVKIIENFLKYVELEKMI
jgi:anthranilate/para-aminobenzoate synthase component II